MKKSLVLLCAVVVLISGGAFASTKKHHAKKHSTSSSDVQGGGYYGGKYHGHKAGDPKKPLLHWDGYNGPIKGMKESAKKPPSTYPSQSTGN